MTSRLNIATAALVYAIVFHGLRLNHAQAAGQILLHLVYLLLRQQFFPADNRNGA